MAGPNFAADIRPLFRSYDIESMKPAGIDLYFYEDVKKGSIHVRPTFCERNAVRRAMERSFYAKTQGVDGGRYEAVYMR